MRFYFEVARTAFRRQVMYRWANLAGLTTNIFFGAIFSYVIIALYQARADVNSHNVLDTLRYTWLMQAILMVIVPFNWNDLMQTIRTGDVVTDLNKPCDFCWYWFSREVGRSVYYLLYRGVPIYIAGMILFGLGLPADWRDWLLGLGLALPLGLLMGVAYRYLYNIIAFWIIEAKAMITFFVVIAQFFTGSYVPVPLLPAWMRTIVVWLPFNGLMNVPVELLLGKLNGWDLALELFRQIGWLLIFIMIAQYLTTQARQRVVVQGG